MSRLVVLLAGLALLTPGMCLAQPTSVEFEANWDAQDTRTSHPKHEKAHQRAKRKSAYSLTVRYVEIEGCWAEGLNLPFTPPGCWSTAVKLPIAPGDVLTPQRVFDAMEALEKIITDDSIQGYGVRSLGELGVLYIEVEYDTSQRPAPGTKTPPPRNTVGVTFRPYYVRFSLARVGDNVLPIPRSPRPTLYENVPAPLLALKPTFGISHDRAFGTAVGAGFDVDLFNLTDPAHRDRSRDGNRHLDVHGQGVKALDEPFHRLDAGLRYRARRFGTLVQEFSLRADYDGVREPLGAAEHTRHAGSGAVGVTLGLGANTHLSLDLGYRRTDDTTDADASVLRAHTTADEQTNRVLLDTIPRPLHGFLRTAIWEDNGWVAGGGSSYQRLAGRFGYAREIAIHPSQTIGLELVAGAGTGWGAVPAYARFFGGNEAGQFLYDGASSLRLLRMPAGPLIRSFGEAQATVRARRGERRGGDAFWHMNLNVALPIPWLSRALIPNETTDLEDAEGKLIALKQLLRKQVDVTGPSMLTAALRHEGMTDTEARAKAEKVLDEIRPATRFIIDDATLYSIKPLMMLDVAALHGGRGVSDETWVAVGGGVQLTIVIAKFEVGYMRTVSGPTFGSQGNVFARLVFQNLF